MDSSGMTVSPWTRDVGLAERRRRGLRGDARTHVLVIGGGIAGITTAFLLAREGISVMVVDDGPLGAGETERTTAHLSSVIDLGFATIERMHGERAARVVWESHRAAVDVVEEIVDELAIDEAGFCRIDGWLISDGPSVSDALELEYNAARRAGFVDVEMHDGVFGLHRPTGPALRFPHQARIHPMRYLVRLAQWIERNGGKIHTGHHITRIEGGASPQARTADGITIHADCIAICTNSPVNDRIAVHTKQTAWRTYAVGLRVPRGTAADILLWDDEVPRHRMRLMPGQAHDSDDLVMVSGEDHRTGHAADGDARWRALAAWASTMFPEAQPVARWSGQAVKPHDGLPFVGKNPGGPKGVFIATGDSGHNITRGTIAGLMLKDLLRGNPHPWADLYDPSRMPLRAIRTFASSNLDVARHYVDHVRPTPYSSIMDIPRNSGGVVRHGLRSVAVACDRGGFRTCTSAVCPHLGGVVQWNDVEKTWDCPMHGSRFNRDGHVVTGPANADLPSVREPGEDALPLLLSDALHGAT